ncbi:EsaB/YukD family protein [Streptococcus sp. CSL10205-OR2]|uniref:EsaB/YukD family protein n=1 Tax=Streptococcus sp. CSL10205-OR2 TaxID=2980558 RepID=UPI0021D93BC7|nr:EsaB/YukD family protein [Streptococcus sp. CSL10205-OR2]MCU9533511.1 EsaB/YukD family protein [Streptococcus sp. CSL10205-OR2]
MDNYIDISIDFNDFLGRQLDLRVPRTMRFKEILTIVSESYGLHLTIENPTARIRETNELVFSTNDLSSFNDGILLLLETL